MAWIGKVSLDPDKLDVGTATAVWNEGELDEFVYSRRAKVSGEDAANFVVEAKAARITAEAIAGQNATLATTLTVLLNA